MTQNPDSPWVAYYAAGSGRSARPLLVDALALFAAHSPDAFPRLAVDLGCGDGTETQSLLPISCGKPLPFGMGMNSPQSLRSAELTSKPGFGYPYRTNVL